MLATAAIAQTRESHVQIYVVDVPARQIAEWGQLLSRPDEDATWNAAIRAEVKQRMDQLLS